MPMTLKNWVPVAILAASFALPRPALAEPVRLIIDRMNDSVEMFLSLPAPLVPTALGGSTEGLSNGDGTFDLGVFRASGTAVEGDAVIQSSQLKVDGAAVKVEAMSVMLHPRELSLPFASPIDGVAAMSICTVLPTESLPSLDNLHLYGGFIAYPAAGKDALEFTLANSETVELMVAEFVNGRPTNERSITVAPGETVQFDAVQETGLNPAVMAAGAVGLTVMSTILGGIGLARARKKRAPAEA